MSESTIGGTEDDACGAIGDRLERAADPQRDDGLARAGAKATVSQVTTGRWRSHEFP